MFLVIIRSLPLARMSIAVNCSTINLNFWHFELTNPILKIIKVSRTKFNLHPALRPFSPEHPWLLQAVVRWRQEHHSNQRIRGLRRKMMSRGLGTKHFSSKKIEVLRKKKKILVCYLENPSLLPCNLPKSISCAWYVVKYKKHMAKFKTNNDIGLIFKLGETSPKTKSRIHESIKFHHYLYLNQNI